MDRTGFYPWYVVAVLLVGSIFAYLDRLVMGFLIDPIKADLHLNDTQMGILNGFAFAAFYVIMGVPLGRLVDTRNRKVILASCMTIWSVATAGCGLAVSYATMFLARVGVGVGEAALNPSAVSIISDTFPKNKVTKAISFYTLSIYIGGGLAIILGGTLIDLFASLGAISLPLLGEVAGWRLVFISVGGPGILVAVVLLLTVREPKRTAIVQLDSSGDTGSLKGVMAYLRSHAKLYTLMFVGFIAFGFNTYTTISWFPAMLMRTYGMIPGDIAVTFGIIYIVGGVGGALSVGFLVRFFERLGFLEAPIILCLSASVVSTIPIIFAPMMPTATGCLALFSIFMVCWGIVISASFSAVALVTPGNMRGIMTGIYMILMNVTGGAFAPVFVGLLSDYLFGADHVRYALSTVGAVTMPIACISFLLLRPSYRKAIKRIFST